MITINSNEIQLKKISKPYSQLSKEDKEYLIYVYYNYKHLKSVEIQKILGISQKTYVNVMKEYGINSRLKNRYTLNENYFEKIDTEEKAYILGLIYADGFVGKDNNFVLSMKDEHIVRDVANAIAFTGDIRKTDTGGFENSTGCYRLNLSSEKLVSDLNKHGVYTCKSLTLDEFPNIESKFYGDFLRGYFDGDGSISFYIKNTTKKGKVYSYEVLHMTILATEPFLLKIKEVFNIGGHIRESKTEELKYLDIQSKEDLLKLYELMYKNATIFLNRKKKIWDDYYKG